MVVHSKLIAADDLSSISLAALTACLTLSGVFPVVFALFQQSAHK
jgi:hypothetical protein